jgi:ribosomal protein L35AE/L33A
MDISSQLTLLEGKDIVFKWGEDGRELKGKISKIHAKHGAFTAEYYDPELEAGAGILAKFDDVESVEGNVLVFKK